MHRIKAKYTIYSFLVIALLFSVVLSCLTVAQAATALSGLTVSDLSASYDGNSNGSWTGQGTAINGSIAASKQTCGSDITTTLTLTNNKTTDATLSFSYKITFSSTSYVGSAKIDGTSYSTATESTYSKTLRSGENITIAITGDGGGQNTTSIAISNISLTVETVDITTTFTVSDNGTYTVDGTQITETTSYSKTTAYTLEATANSGYVLFGWFNTETSTFVSYSSPFTVSPEVSTTIYPVFVSSSSAIFQVESSRYMNLAEANTAALASTNKKITLVQSGTISAGNYEISAGVQLLIPYSVADTGSFSANSGTSQVSTSPSVAYCLTLPENTTITCYGEINVNAVQYVSSSRRTGCVAGAYGAIQMNSGSQLNLESGSVVYAYGYIGGEGTVRAKSGSTIHQLFQIEDWRGGNDASTLLSSLKNNSFVLSQYYVQNIETSLRLDSGANVYVCFGIAAGLGDSKTPQQVSTQLIGTDVGLFHITSGYVIMKYDSSTDRMTLDLYGDIVSDAISLEINMTGLINTSMNSADFIMPLPMNYTLNVKSGSTVTFSQKFKVMPGTIVNIEEGATATLAENAALYLYDVDDWNAGTYTYGGTIYQLGYVYARKGAPVKRSVTQDAILKVDGTATAYGPIYTTDDTDNGGNAGITGSGTITITSHGSTDLKECTGDTNVDTVTCVPAVGTIAGHDGQNSFALGMYKSYNGYWYQYTVTGGDITHVSGGVQSGNIIYTGNTKDTDASVVFSTTWPCVTQSGATSFGTKDQDSYVVGFPERSTANTSILNVTITTQNHSGGTATCIAGAKCSLCGTTYSDINPDNHYGHSDDYQCDGCKLIFIYATNVNLGNDLNFLFAIKASYWDSTDDGKTPSLTATFTHVYADGSTNVQEKVVCVPVTIDGVACYAFTYTGIAAKEMCDYVTVEIFDSTGKPITVTTQDSIRDYANRLLKKYASDPDKAKLRTLLADMLNYGAACQQYFKYDVNNLANKDLAVAGSSNVTLGTLPDSELIGPRQLYVKSNITFRIRLNIDVGKTVTVSYTSHRGGNPKSWNTSVQQATEDGTTYSYIDITSMVVADYKSVISITYGDQTATTSIEDYLADLTTTDPVYQAFANFASSARTYLHKDDQQEDDAQ